MKILLFIDFLGSGGAQRQFVGLAAMLKEFGYDVLAAGYFDDQFYLPFLQKHNVPYTYVKEAQSIKTRIWKMHNFIKNVRPDVVISYLDTPCIVACVSKLMGGKFKLIVSERNTTQKLSLKTRVKFCLYRWADVIVPNSFSQERFIKQHYPNLSAKVKTITNFVDVEQFQPAAHVENIPLRMVCVGRITPQKNVTNLLRALDLVRNRGLKLQVDWFGRSDHEESLKAMRQIICELHLQNMFTVHDQISDIVTEYNRADIFCLPSLYEGFPNVLCEAMCCGKPVVCSRVCDNPDIVKEGENGFLFDPTNVDDMADVIIRMASLSSKERFVMGLRSREIVVNLCSSEQFIKKYIELL